jgi:putative N6-adenine-specific DNA methylase
MPDNKSNKKLYTAAALCAAGAEKALSNELRKLNLQVIDSGYGRVRFRAAISGLYSALIGLRTADRVLLEAGNFTASDFDSLFDGTRNCPWEELIARGTGFTVVKVRSNRSKLMAETSIQSVVHKAAAERLCSKYKVNRLPEGGKTAELRVYIEKDRVSLLLDLSGEPLFKRGYRTEGGTAPLRETTAAAMLFLSGWKRKFPLYDPFCGSGTILIEAAMYAWDMAPGLGRHFAIDDLLIADRNTEGAIRKDFFSKIKFDNIIRIAGSDGDSRIISIAQSNSLRALDLALGKIPVRGIQPVNQVQNTSLPQFTVLALDNAHSPFGNTSFTPDQGSMPAGYIVTNPPYGRRLGETEDAENNYSKMGVLHKNFPGWKFAIISDHSGFESFFGTKADSCREISNGAIQSYYYQYERL